MDRAARSNKIKSLARSLGFDSCGISIAERLHKEEARLEEWLSKGYHGKMGYMANHFEKRLDPRLLVPGAQSVVSLSYNYSPNQELAGPLKLSKYAYGTDYHFVIKEKLKNLMESIRREIGEVNGRVFVDSAPVMERAWAAKAGLGWIGKHSLLLSKKKGSYFFLAQLIVDMDLQPDAPVTDHCGDCTACIDACPTNAIVANQVVDGSKCISYLTIELKDQIPAAFKDQLSGWVFGCDICQDVCPWNRFSLPHKEPAFDPSTKLKDLHAREWQELTEEVFRDVFKGSAVKRAGYLKLKNSIDLCKS